MDGSNGFVVRGKGSNDNLGQFVTGVGDVNGDGIDDFALTSRANNAKGQGDIYFGRTSYPSLATVQKTGKYPGKSGPFSGGDPTPPGPLAGDVTVKDTDNSASDSVGRLQVIIDIDGNGKRDLLATRPFTSSVAQLGIIYNAASAPDSPVIAGAAATSTGKGPASPLALPALIDMATLTDSQGFFINLPSGSRIGGDIVSDLDSNFLIFSSENLGSTGDPAPPVFFLSQTTFSSGSPPPAGVTDVSMWGTAGSPGGKIIGSSLTQNGDFGDSIAVSPAANSFTGDGKPALAIGAPSNTFSSNTTDPGHVYIIFDTGTALVPGNTFDVATLSGPNGFVFEGTTVQDQAGFDVAFVPDVNGDGFDDLLIGIPGANADAGMACVIYGGTGPFPAIMHPADLDGNTGTCISGFDAGDRAGESVCGIPDLDGDGKNEICIGAPKDDPDDGAGGVLTDAGGVYVIEVGSFPTATSTMAPLDVSNLDGNNGFVAPGQAAGDEFGTGCTSPGDVNGDGAPDLACGAKFADFGGDSAAGGEYILCGKAPAVVHTLVAKDDVFTTDEDTPLGAVLPGLDPENLFADNGSGPDVDSLNHPMVVSLASYGSTQGVGTPITIMLSDTTNNQPPPRFTSLNAGIAQINSDGEFTFDPSDALNQLRPNEQVQFVMAYTVIDNNGLQDTAIVTITVNGVNDPPVGIPIIRGLPDPEDKIIDMAGRTVGLGREMSERTVGVTDPEVIDPETKTFEWFDDNGTLIAQGGRLNTGTLSTAKRQALLGKTISLKYKYTDLGGTPESVTSNPTGIVRNPQLTISLSGPGGGTVTSDPAGIDCPPTCTAEFDFDTQVTLLDVPDPESSSPTSPPTIRMDGDKFATIRFEFTDPAPTVGVAAVAPASRSGQAPAGPDDPEKSGTASGPSGVKAAGDPVTVFYTTINAGTEPAQSCSIKIAAGGPATLSYQPTNALNVPVGTPDQPFDMLAGEIKTFVLAFTPVSTTTGTEVFPDTVCDNSNVSPIPGVNGVFLTISDTPKPDILSISATVSNDGIIRINTAGGSGFMSASALNIGVGDDGTAPDPANLTANNAIVTVSADTGGVTLPLIMGVCALDAGGVCINPPSASVDVNVSSQAATMAVFVTATGAIALDPATNRVFMRFIGADGVTRSITSVAITAP